jgi:predicted ribosome quality control (RQC) complex YloA/Tae2 family protein
MELIIDLEKSGAQNLAEYYEKIKKLKAKIQRLEQLLAQKPRPQQKKEVEDKLEHQWYHAFRYAFTSHSKLILIGKSAKQNEILVKKHFTDKDLFFHANVRGASTVILKDGVNASQREKEEAAQMAAVFSKAWTERMASVDVYCLKHEQVTKQHFSPTGAFYLVGKREWFYNTELALKVFFDGQWAIASTLREVEHYAIIKPGKHKKKKVIDKLCKVIGKHCQQLYQLLPEHAEIVAMRLKRPQ